MLPPRADNAKSLANTGRGGAVADPETVADDPPRSWASPLTWANTVGGGAGRGQVGEGGQDVQGTVCSTVTETTAPVPHASTNYTYAVVSTSAPVMVVVERVTPAPLPAALGRAASSVAEKEVSGLRESRTVSGVTGTGFVLTKAENRVMVAPCGNRTSAYSTAATFDTAVWVDHARADLRDVNAFALGTAEASAVTANDSTVTIDGGTYWAISPAASVLIFGGGSTAVTDASLVAAATQSGAGSRAIGLHASDSAAVAVAGTTVQTSGGSSNVGVTTDGGATVTLDTTDVTAAQIGLAAESGATLSASGSTITGTTSALKNDVGTLRVANSILSGAVTGPTASVCTNTFTPTLSTFSCP